MFNVDMEEYIKYQHKYPDVLGKVAEAYNKYEEAHPPIFLALNQHLKIFPVLNSWRIEICYIWDFCRMSMICAYTIYKGEFYDKFKVVPGKKLDREIDGEMIFELQKFEYYLENVIYRTFSILEKYAHGVNLLLDLGLTEREISYARVKSKLYNEHGSHELTRAIKRFEKNEEVLKIIRETRNALTHRQDPLNPSFVNEDLEIDLEEKLPERPEKIIANIYAQKDPFLNTDKFFKTTDTFYHVLTKFIEHSLLEILRVLNDRFQEEQDFYRDQHTKLFGPL